MIEVFPKCTRCNILIRVIFVYYKIKKKKTKPRYTPNIFILAAILYGTSLKYTFSEKNKLMSY